MGLVKKRKMRKILISAFFILLFFSFVSAQQGELENCQGLGLVGDVDNDGNVLITDAIYLLNWLFLGGSQPYCFESADLNSDGRIDITDAVFLLNWLFQGGSPPQNLFFAGANALINDEVNNLPRLGWDYVIEDPVEEEEAREIPEITVQLPNTLSVADLTYESDIKECYVVVKDVETDIEETMLVTEWEWERPLNDEQFIGTGNDISRESFSFMIGPPYLWDGRTYEVAVTCIDTADQEDTIRIRINTMFADAREEGDSCEPPNICCVPADEAPSPENAYCAIDPDYDFETGEDGPLTAECVSATNELGVIAPTPELCNPPQGLGDTINNDLKNKAKLLTAEPSPSPAGPCVVKDMTILRKSSDIMPADFKPPITFKIRTVGRDNDFGHHQGLSTERDKDNKVVNVWRVGYAFLVKARVEGDPDKCPEGQFVQHTLKKIDSKSLMRITSSYNTGNYMYTKKDILKERKHGEREINDFPDYNPLQKVKKYVDIKQGDSENNVCLVKSGEENLWCADDYKEERGGPGTNKKEWTFELKKHMENSLILWHDEPYLASTLVNNGGIRMIPANIFTELKDDFIAIVEDEFPPDEHRFYCKLTGLTFTNKGDKSTADQKVDVTEPTCKCVEQEWTILEDGNEGWKDKGDPREC